MQGYLQVNLYFREVFIMLQFKKCYFHVVLGGMILFSLLFSACANSPSGNVSDSAGTVLNQNVKVLCNEGYSENDIHNLMDILERLNQPVALGTEGIIESGTFIQNYNQSSSENYSEEYLWFRTSAGEKYYAFIQKNSSMIYFVCKGELTDGDYIYRTYQ